MASSKMSSGLRWSCPSTMSNALYTIFSALLFLPSYMILLIKRWSTRFPNRGSGGASRRTTRARLGMAYLRGTALLSDGAHLCGEDIFYTREGQVESHYLARSAQLNA